MKRHEIAKLSRQSDHSEILSLFHHIHHKDGEHEVHHCGGAHVKVDPTVNYTVKHCKCGLHCIDKRYAVGHATDDEKLERAEVYIEFKTTCPDGGWHVESGVKTRRDVRRAGLVTQPTRKARRRTLKMPDPEHLVKRFEAGHEVGVLSRLSRASLVGQEFVLINERLKEGEPTRAWGVVKLQPGRAIPSGPKAVATLGAKIDNLTAREFSEEPDQVWYHPLALVRRYDPPREIKGTVPGRRYSGSVEMQKELTAAQQAEMKLEDERIKVNQQKPTAKRKHRFVAAKYTHPNGHPRCLICGQSERTGSMCNATAPYKEVTVKSPVEKCRYCDNPADGVLVLKDGGAGVPVCADCKPTSIEPNASLELREIDKAEVDPAELAKLSVRELLALLRILERDFAAREHVPARSEDLINAAVFIVDELVRRREDVPDGRLVDEARKLRKRDYAPVGASGETSGRTVKLEEVLDATSQDAVIRRGAVTLVGGICNHRQTDNDFDILIRGPFDEDTLDVIKFRVGRMMAAKDPALSNRIQFHDDKKGGPFTDHVELYDLIMVARPQREVIQMEDVEKADPVTELVKKPGPKPAVVQIHGRGRSLHTDLRLKMDGHLTGWTLFMQKPGAVPDVNTVQQGRQIAGRFGVKGSATFKPLLAPAKVQGIPKTRQPLEWLTLRDQVVEPGQLGATTGEEGVYVTIDRPKWEEGVVRPYFREYFFTGGKHLNGVLFARKLVGRGDGEGQRTPEGETFWTIWLSKDALPSILSTRAVRRGDMPPDGRSWIPQSLEKVTPPEYRYWEHKGDKAKEVRDALVKARYFTDANVKIVDGQFRHVVQKIYLRTEPEVRVAKQDGHVPPKAAQEAAKRGLELRREFGRGGTQVGVARARDISNGKALSVDTLRRMRSYFARHEVDSEAEGWNQGEEGYPSAGKVAWLLWGSDPARAWVERVLARLEKQDNEPGLILVEPHGRLIHTGQKTAMVKERKFDVAGKTYVLLSGPYAYGHVRFKAPREITIAEFERLRSKHQVSDAERKRWWADADRLWYYELESYDGFAERRRYARQQGPQTFVRNVRYVKAAADVRPFVLAQQTWKGQQVVRTGPSKTKWFLMFHAPNGQLHVLKLDANPLEEETVGGIHVHLRSRDLMEFDGFAKPGTRIGGYDVNPTKDTPSYWLVLDRGDVAVLDEEPNEWSLSFSGDAFKGRWEAEAEEPGSEIWTLKRGAGKTEKAIPTRDGIAYWDPERKDPDADRTDLKPLAIFAPQKPADRNSFTKPDELVEGFATTEILKAGIAVEPKLNGRVLVAERDADGRVVIFFEDTRRDRSKYFPALSKAAKALPKTAILVGEMIDYDVDGDPLPRRELAVYGQDKVHDDSRVKIHVWDALYWDGENSTDRPWDERKKFRDKAFKAIKGDVFVNVPSKVANTEAELRDALKWASKLPSSEGAMLKRVDGTYTLGGQTSSDAKFRVTRTMRAIVVGKTLKKPAPGQRAPAKTYVYEAAVGPLTKAEEDKWGDVVEVGGKKYTKIGETFASNVAADVGDTILAEVRELLLDKAEPKRLSWFQSTVIDKIAERPLTTREAESLVRADEIEKFGTRPPPVSIVEKEERSEGALRYVLGVVLEPNDGQDGHPLSPDTQRDIYSEDEIRKAQWRFAEYLKLGERHARAVGDAKVRIVDNFIAPADFVVGGQRIRKGTWMLGAHILDGDLWRKIQTGEYNAWSVDGSAIRVPQRAAA